jgi:hypothetical protein
MKAEDALVIIVKEHKIVNVSAETMKLLLMNIGLLSQYQPKIALKKKTRKLVKRNSRYEKNTN